MSMPPVLTEAASPRSRVTKSEKQKEMSPSNVLDTIGQHVLLDGFKVVVDLVYVRVTKRNLSTPDLVKRLSSTLGIEAQAIGVAGLKDARAVTTQMVSLLGVEADRLAQMPTDDRVLAIEILGRHR